MNYECWIVSSGGYSDYEVLCVFEREEDCNAYVRTYNERDMRDGHDYNVRRDYTPPNAQYKCRDPIETCPGHGEDFKDLSNWTVRMERLPFHPAGEIVPVLADIVPGIGQRVP